MRAEILEWVQGYPKEPGWKDGTFGDSPIVRLVNQKLPEAVRRAASAELSRFLLKSSAGNGTWTHTPWLAILDPMVTTSVQEGLYVVYLLSRGCERLYLTINQGCTSLKDSDGLAYAKAELARRADIMRTRVLHSPSFRVLREIDLNANLWRSELYEDGVVLGTVYDTSNLPPEHVLVSDLLECVDIYQQIIAAGGSASEDEIRREAQENDIPGSLEQAKRYRQHRGIERQSHHSKKVKKLLGTRCMGCEFEMTELYGEAASGLIEAHHLMPLSHLADGSVVRLDPKRDFAVLCPNCHRVIHRLDRPDDLDALRNAVRGGLLARRR